MKGIKGLRRLIGMTAILALVLPCGAAQAQFYKVYGYKTPDAKAVELTAFTTHVASSEGTDTFFGTTRSREGLWAHALEVEYGLSHRFTVGAYVDLLDARGDDLHYAQTRLLVRYRLWEKGTRPVDIALYGELYLPDDEYKDYQKFETRIILEKDLGPIRIDLNPKLEKKISGADVEEGLEFAYAAGVYYNNFGMGLFSTPNFSIHPGVEFYGELGEFGNAPSVDEQEHLVFPTLDLFAFHYFHWNVGVGFGLTDHSDDVIVKSVFSFEYLF